MAAAASTQPNTTLYVNNLNDKINKEELRAQLYALFTTYGKIIDVVASKTKSMRGQAFLVFSDLAGATAALRALEGATFYDKPLRIAYAKTKSHATLRREDPTFTPPKAAKANGLDVKGAKRHRDDGADEVAVAVGEKKAKREEADSDDEMEIDDDDDDNKPVGPPPRKIDTLTDLTSVPPPSTEPTARLLCTNLPQEVTSDVLSVLFQPYDGFSTTRVQWSLDPSPPGARQKCAQVLFESPELAAVAKEALDGFMLKKDWNMSVVYI